MIQRAKQIVTIFRENHEECVPVVESALRIKEYLRSLSPFIDRHTARVCHGCSTNCCINRHAYYTLDDLIYIHAQGLVPEVQELNRPLYEESCQFLTSTGCALERHQRPSGCTWHFCDDLTVQMQEDDREAYANFSDMFDDLFLTWLELSGAFRILYREKYGQELDENSKNEVYHGLTFPWVRVRPIPFSPQALKER